MEVSQTIRRAGLGLGAIVLAGGLVLLLAPGAAGSVPIGFMFAQLGAVVAFLLGIWVVRQRYRSHQNLAFVSDVEFRMSSPTPGDEVDDLIYRLTELREGTLKFREQIQTRVAEVAITVIMQRRDCSRDQAIKQLEDGSWTDNAAAAGFFIGATGDGSSSIVDDLLNRFRSGDSAYEQQLETTISEIERLGEFEVENGSGGDDEGDSPAGRNESQHYIAPDDGESVSDTARYRALLSTHHWTGITAFALVALAAGIFTAQPSLILAGGVGIGVSGYAQLDSRPPLANLAVTREVSDDTPSPGSEIEVTVTVENTGNTFLTDLRLIDHVPSNMEVIDGSARLGTALRSGQTATFNYTAIVERGRHSWPVRAIGRGTSGAVELDALIDADTTVNCLPRLRTATDVPVRLQTSIYSGEVNTNIGGEGLEFHSVRDYQPGDPKRRIDWRSFAKTGDFSTIDFREEHAARIVLLFDGRESSYVASGPGEPHSVDRSITSAFDIFASLYDQGHLVGIAGYNGIPCWVGPNTGAQHLQRVRELLVDHPALSSLPPEIAEEETGRYIDPIVHVRRRLPANTQIFLFSPLTDNFTYEVARHLDGAGHLVTLISPDPTSTATIGQRIGRLERSSLVKRLRDHGIRVVDWGDDESLNIELEHAKRRWNA